MSADGWDGILDKDEEIRWQGRPDGRVTFSIGNLATFAFGLFFAGFALVWMIMAASAGGLFWMFGLLHFAVGLAVAFGAIFFSAYRRRRTWYTLTNKRAFVATVLPFQGRRLKSYVIDDETVVELAAGDPASIFFATETRRTKNGTRAVRVGFERVPDGQTVYRLIRDIQKGPA